MIFPWLKGTFSYDKIPITWALIVFNIFVFMVFSDFDKKTKTPELNRSDLVISGRLYFEFRNRLSELKSSKNSDLKAVNPQTENDWILLGAQGLQNKAFMDQYLQFDFHGDQIAIQNWKDKILKFQIEQSSSGSHLHGLQSTKKSWMSFITYQFMHAHWMHLISNMAFLLIFAAAVELTLGGLFLIGVYVLGGVFAAQFFLTLGQDSLAPMIGASGSLSAVMAAYAAYEKKKRVPFFYFISPFRNFYGKIYLPTYFIFVLCFLPDIVGWLTTPTELGSGVAYTAHIGGAVFGAALGFGMKYFNFNPTVHTFRH